MSSGIIPEQASGGGTQYTDGQAVATSNGNTIQGVIQNVGATTFDIAWTETGTAVAQAFLWEAQ